MNAAYLVGEVIEQVARRSAKAIGGKAMSRFDKKVMSALAGDGVINQVGRGLWNNKGYTIDTGVGLYSYYDAKKEGKSTAEAVGEGIENGLMPVVLGPFKFLALEAAASMPEIAVSAYNNARDVGNSIARSDSIAFSNAQFQDNDTIATMRQAGMAMAEQSQLNLKRATLGNEASYNFR